MIFINLNLHYVRKHSFEVNLFWFNDFGRVILDKKYLKMVSHIVAPPSPWGFDFNTLHSTLHPKVSRQM
jgi:hypothetical protein